MPRLTKNSFKQKLHSDWWTHNTYHKPPESEVFLKKTLAHELVTGLAITVEQTSVTIVCSIIVVYTLFVLGICMTTILFPFYCKLFKLNRDKENDSPIYPILQHFHKIVCVYFIEIFFFILQFFFFTLTQIGIPRLLFFFPYVILSTSIAPVFNILLILLAVQRFTIYFLPDFEKFVSFKSRTWTIVVLTFYGLSLVCSGIHLRNVDWREENGTPTPKENRIEFDDYFDELYTVFFRNEVILKHKYFQYTNVYLDIFSMLSVLLYCPIFVSIRTKTYLVSALNSKPDRYIRYQAVFIALSKVLDVVFLVYNLWKGSLPPVELKWIFLAQSLANFGATPFIIQITYLSCNKRNVQAMLSMICPRCLCRNPRRNNVVAPAMLMDGETTVHAIPNN
ncbi:hypothetical protein CAEBREN_03745 [Caenorhabditis brenneri]|uniref:G-protein coupled receptors family 1 profile domain-containing protein n=1 Tax=Caenorhabditis brenneri TaxID=135651 RepID=G0MD04_CAEBE|nr:hypothetical protein CAEBREN_03745 [Caenorhabditis brenneri]